MHHFDTGGVAVPRLINPASHQKSETITPVAASNEWLQLCEVALLENDPTKVRDRIAEARQAILDRIEDLLTSPYTAEHHALSNAFRLLCTLKEPMC